MRVKLSYTVEDEDVLAEAGKLLSLSATDMQQLVDLFNGVQAELKSEKKQEDVVNIPRVLEMIEEYRSALLNVDVRLSEVAEIIEGYEHYIRSTTGASGAAATIASSVKKATTPPEPRTDD